ncbi:hypothetical protein BGZ88_001412 [Linnemannia elongata]|nr:hypothetical protein BGZ88_001412 [Linnemannia elongata]KAG0044875.1 hypothetical protein BGZ89_005891 [Linnemannia elongata]
MASHLHNLRDTGKTHHYDLRDSTVAAAKDHMLHSTADKHQNQAQAHAQGQAQHGQAHTQGQGQGQDHTQKSHTGHQQQQHQQRDHHASVLLATGTEANLEHPVNPEHDPTHPGH